MTKLNKLAINQAKSSIILPRIHEQQYYRFLSTSLFCHSVSNISSDSLTWFSDMSVIPNMACEHVTVIMQICREITLGQTFTLHAGKRNRCNIQ
jgi:hypothetical protein